MRTACRLSRRVIAESRALLYVAEAAFVAAVAKSLTPGGRKAFAALLDRSPELLSDAAALGDGLEGLAGSGAGAHAQPKPRTFVLRFNGDVQASQVESLREEVTAVVQAANASRGDEVRGGRPPAARRALVARALDAVTRKTSCRLFCSFLLFLLCLDRRCILGHKWHAHAA